jgi:hypothetical protein
MRKLTILLLAAGGTALALPAAAQVVYQSAPVTSTVVAPGGPAVVVAPSAPSYAYVAPAAPTNCRHQGRPRLSRVVIGLLQ